VADPRIHDLYRQLVSKQVDRRGFMKRAAALGISAQAAGFFLKAADVRAQDAKVPPVVATPCAGDTCLWAGKEITVQVQDDSVKIPYFEVRDEFEAATGAKVNIIAQPVAESFPILLDDAASGTNQFDAAMIGMWWLGDLVAGDYIMPFDDFYADTSGKFPQFNFDDELPGVRALRVYDGKKYVVPYDADGQVLYYRRDVLTDATHMSEYKAATGNDLRVPQTWEELRDIATYFKGKDLNGDGEGDHGITMHLKVGGQGMFHYFSLSAPYVIGPENTNLYWFDTETMDPLVESEGHKRAINLLQELYGLGPEAQAGWALGEAWQYFLDGKAVFTFSWGDVAALAVERNSYVKGKIGTVQLPGTLAYVNPKTGQEYPVEAPNIVGNTTGGSWAAVIMKASDEPELAYYFLALMATEPKQRFYATRGTDGVDPGRLSQMPPEAVPEGTGDVADYTSYGWEAQDAIDYVQAYYNNYQNPLQLPFLRIPGTFEYWTSMDVRLSEAITGQSTPEEALANAAQDFRDINDRLGVEQQLDIYRKSLGL
jgi:multiple sugar transport system substrate-binding protein